MWNFWQNNLLKKRSYCFPSVRAGASERTKVRDYLGRGARVGEGGGGAGKVSPGEKALKEGEEEEKAEQVCFLYDRETDTEDIFRPKHEFTLPDHGGGQHDNDQDPSSHFPGESAYQKGSCLFVQSFFRQTERMGQNYEVVR